jgi:Ca2+-binding RTX toxin-like protein
VIDQKRAAGSASPCCNFLCYYAHTEQPLGLEFASKGNAQTIAQLCSRVSGEEPQVSLLVLRRLFIVPVTSAALVVMISPSGAGHADMKTLDLAAVAMCGRSVVTLSGTSGDDVIQGTRGDDVIAAGAGDDVIRGRAGRDEICGGTGQDHVIGGAGRDFLLGRAGDDWLEGRQGRDSAYGERGDDRVSLGMGRDSNGAYRWEEFGNDVIRGGPGDDYIGGGQGSDAVYGGDGADYLGDREPDGSGMGAIAWLNGSDRLFGGHGPDGLVGSRGPNHLVGGSGRDWICGGPAPDLIEGRQGSDSADGDGTSSGRGTADTFTGVEHKKGFCYFL